MEMKAAPLATEDEIARRAQHELRALLDAAVDGVIVISHDGTIESFNRAAERLFGFASAEVIGKPVGLLMPEPYRASHPAYVKNYQETGRARIIGTGREVEARRQDGSVFPVSLAVGEIAGSNPRRFIGLIHDISARKAAVDALRRERDRAQSYLDLAEVMLVAIDADARITMINRKGCEILGYAEPELLDRDWFDQCVPERERDRGRAILNDIMAGTQAPYLTAEHRIRTRDGAIRMIAWRASVMRDEHGRPVGLLSSGEDVTERRRAEEAVQRSEALLRAAQAVANFGNFEVTSPDGPPLWSEQMYRITGRDPALGPLSPERFAEAFVHPDDREAFTREWRQSLAQQTGFDLEYRIVRPDGVIKNVHSQARIEHSTHGQGSAIIGTLHDITARTAAAEELRQSQEKLTHVARLSTMGEMATGLAHEINQPLTAIATYSQAVSRMLDLPGGADPDDLRDALKQITAQALRAGEVIRRLRTFVKNRATWNERLDLNQVIDDLRVLADPDARVNDVRLTLALAAAVPPVSGDLVQIQQVLLNLIRNAIEATVEAGVTPREIVVSTAVVGDGVEVSVMDRGAGIAPDVAEHLFNPFFTTKPTGTGLGLAISRSIIRTHRGKLSHRPTPGGGTKFYFTLPIDAGG